MAIGIFIARLILGLALASHGAQKLFGWFGGYGPKATGGFFESIGFRPGTLFAVLAGIGEFAGGLLTALGWLNPIGPALIISVMVVAMLTVHVKNGFFASTNGIELPLMNSAGALVLAFAGPGPISIDALMPIPALADPITQWIIIGVAVLGAVGSLVARRPTAPQTKVATQG